MALWLGLDIGATTTKVVVVDGNSWTVRERQTDPTDRRSPQHVIARCAELAKAWRHRFPELGGVGFTIPGLFDRDSGRALIVPNIPGQWRAVPVREPIARSTGLVPTLINDARAFGLAESRLGAARTFDDVVGIVIGTGVGGAVVLGGRLFGGHAGNAGEIGHQVLLPDGPACGCGNRGCLEALARSDVVAAAAGHSTVKTAAAAARAGDDRARRALADAGRWIARGLANVVTVLTPQAVVVGGGVVQAGEFLLAPLRAELVRRSPLVAADTYEVLTAELGTFAGAVGAAVAASDAGRESRIDLGS